MPSYDDLIEQIELPQCQCLNAASEHTLRHCLEAEQREEAGTYLESDADEELLITLKFMQAVRISGLIVSTASGSADSAPKNLKLFVNKVGLDFDSARSDKCVQEVELTKSEVVGGARVELRFVNFQGVQELGIFVGSNQGDEELTRISKLVVLGELVQHSGMKRTAEQQASASKGDWLGKGVA